MQITQSEIERERRRQLKKWRKKRGELRSPPQPRLYGAREVHDHWSARQPTVRPEEDLTTAPGAPSIMVRGPPSPGRHSGKEPGGDKARGKPAARSRTFYVQRCPRPPPVPTRASIADPESLADQRRTKRNSDPLISDTYF
ncbi:hypothetical protein scyTo_0027753 [Scyliorhinus torazame]|uniref:Uncharacterized protein n=1 Tax=Scyliorhinus torazame TaxID=75743 RepID=A0A401QNX1_SCYTO|nr:hypothetical protein [Scyliorhinus torazame]